MYVKFKLDTKQARTGALSHSTTDHMGVLCTVGG